MAYQKHGLPPCVVLGRARPTDVWCPGCTAFAFLSEAAQTELDQEAEARRKRN
jgi:hypothetical protein